MSTAMVDQERAQRSLLAARAALELDAALYPEQVLCKCGEPAAVTTASGISLCLKMAVLARLLETEPVR